jgi:hypothetical protein
MLQTSTTTVHATLSRCRNYFSHTCARAHQANIFHRRADDYDETVTVTRTSVPVLYSL